MIAGIFLGTSEQSTSLPQTFSHAGNQSVKRLQSTGSII
jgi:hypothetical protein